MPRAVAHPRWVCRGVRWRRPLLPGDALLPGASDRDPSDPRASAFAPFPGINGMTGRAPKRSPRDPARVGSFGGEHTTSPQTGPSLTHVFTPLALRSKRGLHTLFRERPAESTTQPAWNWLRSPQIVRPVTIARPAGSIGHDLHRTKRSRLIVLTASGRILTPTSKRRPRDPDLIADAGLRHQYISSNATCVTGSIEDLRRIGEELFE